MLRSLIALKPRDVPLRVALRNTVAVIAPLPEAAEQAAPPAALQVHVNEAMPAGSGSARVDAFAGVMPLLASVTV